MVICMKLNLQKLIDDILSLADKLIPDATKKQEFKLKIFELRSGLRNGTTIDILSYLIFANYILMKLVDKLNEYDIYMLLGMFGYQFLGEMPKLAQLYKKKKK